MKPVFNFSSLFLFTALFLANINLSDGHELIVIKSDNLHCNDSILVFTPAVCGDTIPTLFLLHGWSGCYKDWSNKYDIQAISDKYGFRIICPDGFYNGWYVNSIYEDGMQWRDFFDQELFPLMVEKYGIVPEKTFITGLSMGGHGSINLFIDHPERFAAAGSMSGVLNLLHTTLVDSQVAKVLGPYNETNEQRYVDESAVSRLDRLVGSDKILIITCGYGDKTYSRSAIEFCAKCQELDIPYIEILSPGTHSWKYWGFALEQHLQLFTKIMNGANLGY